MIELFEKNNTWYPPVLDKTALTDILAPGQPEDKGGDRLIIFKTTPYIDSVYVHYEGNGPESPDGEPPAFARFTFHEGYVWSEEQEKTFLGKCINNPECMVTQEYWDQIYKYYSKAYPQWHLKRYYIRPVLMLDHIYNCLKQDTAREMLYKAGLDGLACHVGEMDELNLLAGKPSEIYDGLSMRTLRALNGEVGAGMLADKKYRKFFMGLQKHYPDIFKTHLNDAQCRYIKFLIDGDVTVGEAGRLYLARRRDLMMVWSRSQYDMFIHREMSFEETRSELDGIINSDPIYRDYFHYKPAYDEDFFEYGINMDWENYFDIQERANELRFYLTVENETYNRKIRQSNRTRPEEWQERNNGYVVRYPQTINDFCREAVYMRNCLLSYVDAFAYNDTTILFMRKPDAVNQPFITIEIFGNELKQAYHRFNGNCTAEEAAWIREYCRRHNIGCGTFTFGEMEDGLF